MRLLSVALMSLATVMGAACAATPVPSPSLPPATAPVATTAPSPSAGVATPTFQPTAPPPPTTSPSPTPAPTSPPPTTSHGPTLAPPTPTATPTATPTTPPTATPTPPPATTIHLKGACLSIVNEPYQGFDRYLILDASFDETNLKGIRVAMTSANDDLPVDGTQPLAGLWQVTLGLNEGTRNNDLSFILAEAILANDKVESFVEALRESIGSMENLRPNYSVGESCGGF